LRTKRISLSVALVFAAGCGGDPGLAPETVASSWAKRSLDKDPDIVVSVDMAALQHDAFFGKIADLVLDDAPLPYDAVRGASRIDFFATMAKTFTAVVYGAGAPPAGLMECISPGIAPRGELLKMTVMDGKWVVSTAAISGGAVPGPVDMDGHALFEAWLGPGAVDEALNRARWDTREMWRHLHAFRLRIEGGATPGMVVDARFETEVDAEHAQYDLARMQRALERIGGEVRDEELAKQLLEQIPNVHVARSGNDLRVDFHLTAGFTQYISTKLDRERPAHRTRRGGC